MSLDRAPVTSPWTRGLIQELSEKAFRDAYMIDHVRTNIAFQIRTLREQPSRDWSQAELAARAGKKQSVISRLEDPDYGKLSLQSLLDIAVAFDVPLLVQFVEWDDWLVRMGDVSPPALQKRSFDPAHLWPQSAPVSADLVALLQPQRNLPAPRESQVKLNRPPETVTMTSRVPSSGLSLSGARQ